MHLPSPAFNNTIISNAYKGTNQVSKILLGLNHVWPLAPVFSFDTYQAGGELNFTVAADVPYVACMINDSDVFIYKTAGINTNAIQAINLNATAYNNLYQSDSTSSVIDISLPLYQRKQVRISGTGTRVTRYNADYNTGNIRVEVFNPYGSNIDYTVSLTGKGSITKTCVVGIKTTFSFTSVSKGTRTVTLQNLSDGTSTSTAVDINVNSAPIPTQNLTVGLNKVSPGTSDTLTDVKVYSLTESEALLSIHGSAPVIAVRQKYIGVTSGYRGDQYHYELIFDLISSGSGLPANSQIQMRWVNLVSVFNGTVYEWVPLPLHVLTLVTGSVGNVVALGPGTYWRYDQVVYDNLPAGTVINTPSRPEMLGNVQSWAVKSPINVIMSITRKTRTHITVPDSQLTTGDFRDNWIHGGAAGILFIGTNSPISLVNYLDYELVNLNSGAWVKNLLFDNQDLVGNLQSVDLKDINVNSITSTTQRELQIIRSSYINTSTNKALNSSVKIVNTPEFKSTHGSEVTYQYYNGTWPYGFNPLIYRQFYPNTIGAAYGPSDLEGLWYHYKTWGAEQGFTHSTDFLAQDYLDLNPDLQAAFGSDPSPRTSAMLHWFSYGIAEGRQGRK